MATRGFTKSPGTFVARYPGTCANCEEDINPGDTARYDAYDEVVHNRCATAAVVVTAPRGGRDDVCPDCNEDHAGECF